MQEKIIKECPNCYQPQLTTEEAELCSTCLRDPEVRAEFEIGGYYDERFDDFGNLIEEL